MNRTLMGEIIGGIVALVIVALVGGLWTDVKDNRDRGIQNKDNIESGVKVGEGEIRRSTDVDINQKEDIDGSRVDIKEIKSDNKEMYRELGEIKTAIEYLHKGKK